MTEYITDSVKALAVSGVVINSQELANMKNAIIYDVPGFNAPTALHKAQTLKRMEEADAIIVIAKGDEPSLTDEPLKILYESDSDGNLLKDKLFVFANKTERSTTISKNIQITKKEWISKGFIDEWKAENRIFFGCALAHLQSLNLCLDKDGSSRALREFEEKKSQMPHGDGIQMIRAELEKYNHTERFKVLKSRIDRIKANIKKTLNEIPLDFDSIANRSYGFEHIAIATAFCCKTPSVVEASLLELRDHIRNYMPKEKPLSKKITKYIMENITKEKYAISDEIIDRAKKQSPYTGTFEDTARIEGDIRKLKFKEMEQNYGSFTRFPDLVLMDGGKGQVNIAQEVLSELRLSIPVCGMVKDDHHRTRGLYFQNKEIEIDTHSEGFKLITRIQDEAHRFAIEYHRSLRSKEQVRSVLDEIPGVGPARRKALMKYFENIDAIKEADAALLHEKAGIPLHIAQEIYSFFHGSMVK